MVFDDRSHRLRQQLTLNLEGRHMAAATMDQILDALNSAHQRATYGAVAAIVGVSPRALMKGRERSPRHSWIVNLKSGLPTDYAAELVHPDLTANDTILKSGDDLGPWLASRGVHLAAERAA